MAYKLYDWLPGISFIRMLRQPPTLAGRTQASSVKALVRFRLAEWLMLTRSLTPSKFNAPPNLPAGVHVASTIVPWLLAPDESASVAPLPALKL